MSEGCRQTVIDRLRDAVYDVFVFADYTIEDVTVEAAGVWERDIDVDLIDDDDDEYEEGDDYDS